ncbi:hypothetical protein [Streptomyces verrucosisporus]|uniref:hypothetical protein n=1 Tax=Streptomyces verrucosisporus TaxID=1695161 RepID=UPI0027DA7DD8|nr:hypothetical protein [Streptomyces verrucosisporus]
MSTEADPVRAPLPPVVPPRPAVPPGAPRVAAAAPPIATGPPPPRFDVPLVYPDAPAAAPEPGRRVRGPVRTAAAVVCLVLGLGLLGGAAAGVWLTGDSGERPAADYAETRSLWREIPVDTIFPRSLRGRGAGPGRADRRWTRVAVAPDADCRDAFDPSLAEVLSPAGCERLLRATYADETGSGVTTVGLLFTEADEKGMRALRERFDEEDLELRADLMPRPYAARGTAAARFGDAQRASWTIRPLTDAPVVVYTVSGFADGRTVGEPQPASEAVLEDQTTAPAQAGLGHDARGIADRIERGLRHIVAQGTGQDR